jgi:hypothetical protein
MIKAVHQVFLHRIRERNEEWKNFAGKAEYSGVALLRRKGLQKEFGVDSVKSRGRFSTNGGVDEWENDGVASKTCCVVSE